MKAVFLIILMVSGSIAVSAQDLPAGQAGCDPEALKTQPGKWLPQLKDSFTNEPYKISAADIAGARKILSRIQQLFQEKYKPTGIDAYHHYHFMNDYFPGSNTYGNRYTYTIRNFPLYCLGGKMQTSAEGVGSFVHVNRGGSLYTDFSEIPVYDEHGEVNKDGSGFYYLSLKECKNGKLPDLTNGYLTCDDGNLYSVWITKEGKQPFRYVSRKEFLEKQVAIRQAQLKDLNEYYASDKWKKMIKVYEDLGQKEAAEKGKMLGISMQEKPLEAYRQDLKKDAAWLNEMAVVKFEATAQLSRYVFTTLDDGYMQVPIMPNPDYYDRKLPKWAPQFILIEIRAADRFFGKNLRKVVDENIEYFKSLLVK